MVQKEIGNAIIEYQKFSRTVRMKHEHVPAGTMRSIQEIINDERRLSASIVAAVSKQLVDYLRLLHESFIAIDQLCETNIYIEVNKTKVNKPVVVVIDAKQSIAADERALQENIFQFGNLLRKLVSKFGKGFK
ncbi:uncharacterized protein LOC132716803 [Ruditapes philippinarum]|uniref:uncharacterized protein LOC132716803 n=1 Tax=Ruditapes philippinarum TaxID=129788 RepID=UPI00295B5C5E|nr:uncharacterized protein LOC132716803 [Ruditapes philippinarum]